MTALPTPSGKRHQRGADPNPRQTILLETDRYRVWFRLKHRDMPAAPSNIYAATAVPDRPLYARYKSGGVAIRWTSVTTKRLPLQCRKEMQFSQSSTTHGIPVSLT
jgi:hypothetical protein